MHPKRCTSGSGRGPLEKDPQEHLASGLPVLKHSMDVFTAHA